ncbi:hypothetical protein TWF718_009857 [Orbilia javanica]|uniref:Peptidase S8/S53 domain-containing protein n=1 Tax=Orbilia javanica TaxID=47235 RepID=A0AAN8MU41_9PEZI
MDLTNSKSKIRVVWELLGLVLSPFISSLPLYRSTQGNLGVRGTIVLIRAKLEWIGSSLGSEIYIRYLPDVPHDIGEKLYEALYNVLEILETFVVQDILCSEDTSQAESSIWKAALYLEAAKFLQIPRILHLQALIVQSSKSRCGSQAFAVKKYFSSNLEEQPLSVFHSRLGTLEETISQAFDKILPSSKITAIEDSIMAARVAREFGKSAETVFETIATQMDDHCNTKRDGFIRIPVVEKRNIEMLLPVCSNAKSGHLHPTFCSLSTNMELDEYSYLGRSKDETIKVVCESIWQSKMMQRKLALQLRNGYLWEQDSNSRRCTLSEQIYLGDFIWAQGGSTDRFSTFTHQNRAEVPVLLARSMLHLYNTRWFQHLWDMDRLLLCADSHQSLEDRSVHPYLASTLSLSDGNDTNYIPTSFLNENSCDPLYRHELVLSFGLRLLEIESGMPFPATDQDRLDLDDEENGPQLVFLTLQRALTKFEGKGQIEDGYYKIAKTCLDFHKILKKKPFRDIDASLRELVAIHNLIFSPLLQLLAKKFSGAAADLLELEADIQNMKLKDRGPNADVDCQSAPPVAQPPPTLVLTPPKPQRMQKTGHGDRCTILEPVEEFLGEAITTTPQNAAALKPRLCVDEIRNNFGLKPRFRKGRDNNVRSFLQVKVSETQSRSEATTMIPNSPQANCENNEAQELPNMQRKRATMLYEANDLPHDNWWGRLAALNGLLRATSSEKDSPDEDRRSKIAVLDTGILLKDPYAENIGDMYKDFVDKGNLIPEDLSGHGTDTVNFIFRAYETAEIYVARVFQTEKADEDTAERVVEAINWAREKNVDIIVMALGFSRSDESIENAVNAATAKGILVFAAAGNWGGHDKVAFPARLENVFCIFAATPENKNYSDINPPHDRRKAHNFAILGEDIKPPTEQGKSPIIIKGTSISCAIAAGLAGSFIDFSRQRICREDHRLHNFNKKRNISALFEEMSTDYKDGNYYCITPWKILEGTSDAPDRNAKRRKLRSCMSKIVENCS